MVKKRASMQPLNAIAILGIPVDNVSACEVLCKAEAWISNPGGAGRYIATVNLDFLMNSSSRGGHPELLKGLAASDLSTADGMPLLWMSRLMGHPLKERSAGADLLLRLLELADEKRYRIYLFGGDPEALEEVQGCIRSRFPHVHLAGAAAPEVHTAGSGLERAFEEDLLFVHSINREKPDLLFLALGNPKQELWFQRIRHRLEVPLSIGIGGSYSFLSGRLKRAPLWMQRAGLEWLFRLLQEPKRLIGRYLKNGLFFLSVCLPWALRYRLLLFRKGSRLPPRKGALLNLEGVESLDAEAVAELARFAAKGRAAIWGVSNTLKRQLIWYRLFGLLSPCLYASEEEARASLVEESPLPYRLVEKSAGSLSLLWKGPLDASLELGELLDELQKEIGARSCLLDLGGCPFLDSSGMGFLLRLKREVEKSGSKLLLCGAREGVLQTLKISGLSSLFSFAPSLQNGRGKT